MSQKKDYNALIQQYYDGDSKVLDDISKQIITQTRNFSLRYRGSVRYKEDLEDIVMASREKIIKNIIDKKYSHKASIDTYIFAVLRNTFVDYTRKNKRNPIERISENIQIQDTTFPTIDYRKLYDHCIQIVSTLNPQVQNIFELRFVNGEHYEDIAEKLDMKPKAVVVSVHRLKKILREKLPQKAYTIY